MPAITEELIDFAAAAALLGVGKTTVVYLVERGDLTLYLISPTDTRPQKRYVAKSQVKALAASTWRRRRKVGE